MHTASGGQEIKWGQTVSYVRCPDGTFVDLSSPVAPGRVPGG